MWNSKRSATLSLAACIVMAVLVVLLMVFLPQIIRSYAEIRNLTNPAHFYKFYTNACWTVYPASVIGLAALYFLVRMLRNIQRDDVFVTQNITYLRVISWCCFALALVTVLGGIYYPPFLALAAAAAFVGLIVRVMKNLMKAATAMREERDLTI